MLVSSKKYVSFHFDYIASEMSTFPKLFTGWICFKKDAHGSHDGNEP